LSAGELQKLLIPIWAKWLPPKMKFFFTMADKDGNGFIEGQELQALKTELVRKFMVTDTMCEHILAAVSGDSTRRLDPESFKGVLSTLMKRSRFSKFHPGMVSMFKEIDKDRSGLIENAEMRVLASHLQDKFDVDSEVYNGIVAHTVGNSTIATMDLEEYRTLAVAVMRASPFFQMHPKIVLLFKRADHNKNLLIDGAELEFIAGTLRRWFGLDGARYEQMFARADADADSSLTPQEFSGLVLAAKSMQTRHSTLANSQQDTRLAGQPEWVHRAVQNQVKMIVAQY